MTYLCPKCWNGLVPDKVMAQYNCKVCFTKFTSQYLEHLYMTDAKYSNHCKLNEKWMANKKNPSYFLTGKSVVPPPPVGPKLQEIIEQSLLEQFKQYENEMLYGTAPYTSNADAPEPLMAEKLLELKGKIQGYKPASSPPVVKPKCLLCGESLYYQTEKDRYQCTECNLSFSADFILKTLNDAKSIPELLAKNPHNDAWTMKYRMEIRLVPLFYHFSLDPGKENWVADEGQALYSDPEDVTLELTQEQIDQCKNPEEVEQYVIVKIQQVFEDARIGMYRKFRDTILDRYVTRGLKKLLDKKIWAEDTELDPSWINNVPEES